MGSVSEDIGWEAVRPGGPQKNRWYKSWVQCPYSRVLDPGQPPYVAKFRLIECVAPTLHAGLKGKVVVSQLLLADRQFLLA